MIRTTPGDKQQSADGPQATFQFANQANDHLRGWKPRESILAFAGHRPPKVGGYDDRNAVAARIKTNIRHELLLLKPKQVISGMAQGVDQWAARIALDLCIPVIAAVPCDNQQKPWPHGARKTYVDLLELCQSVHVISPGPYEEGKMQVRNVWMVDHCQLLFAIWNGKPGGTANCVKYARECSRPILWIKP